MALGRGLKKINSLGLLGALKNWSLTRDYTGQRDRHSGAAKEKEEQGRSTINLVLEHITHKTV